MTTIAFDGKTLCIDSQASTDRVCSRSAEKMFLNVGPFPCVVAGGSSSDVVPMLGWLAAGADPRASNWDSWDCVGWAVTKEGEVLRYVGPYPETVEVPDADGAGAHFALGAMAAGASAVEAMEVACHYDLYTGGEIHAFEIPQALSLVSNEAS